METPDEEYIRISRSHWDLEFNVPEFCVPGAAPEEAPEPLDASEDEWPVLGPVPGCLDQLRLSCQFALNELQVRTWWLWI